MRKINLPFVIGLLVFGAATATGVHLLHAYQVRRNASALLERAQTAEAANDLEKAEVELSRYLSINPKDAGAWERYARLLDRKTPEGPERSQVYLVFEQALRANPDDLKLERRCAEIGLELVRFSDARRHLLILLDHAPRDAEGEPADAGLEELLGRCDQGESKASGAEGWYRKAIAHDPRQVETYDRLARLLRADAQTQEESDRLIEEMVKGNPESARAYLSRWRYRNEFGLEADPGDVLKAFQLDPEDSDVLLTAALLSQQKGDLDAARDYLRKGMKLAPRNPTFPLRLARLELSEGRLDRAETVLREAVDVRPQFEVWYMLADTLISLGKLEGKDQATDYIDRLRSNRLLEGYVHLLDGRILIQRQRWSEATSKINSARALLTADAPTLARLNLMLAECYDRMGLESQRRDALERAAGDDSTVLAAGPALAEELARSGKLDEAVKIHLRLLNRRPESNLDLARLLVRKVARRPNDQQLWRQAEEQLQKAEKALPKSTEELTLLRSELLVAGDRSREAQSLIEAAIVKEPRNVRYQVASALIAENQGSFDLALQILDRSDQELGPSLDLALARLSVWNGRDGAEAKAAISQSATTRSRLPAADQPAFLRALATSAHRVGELPLARQSLHELLGLEPDNLEVMIDLFDLALEADDSDEAGKIPSEMRRVEGDEGTLWRYGQALYLITQARSGDDKVLQTARGLILEIRTRRADWWGGPLLEAKLAELKGDKSAATAAYVRAVELGNSNPLLVRRLLDLLDQSQDFDRIDRVLTTLQERGVVPEALTAVAANNAIRRKEYDRGVALARRAFPTTSPRASDHLALGRILATAGRMEEAGKQLHRALELGPELPEAWLEYVRLLVQTKQLDQAKSAVAAAGKALPAERAALTLAQCFALVGDPGRAEGLFQQALAAQPDDPTSLRLAAGFFVEQHQNDRAQPLLAKLIDPRIGALKSDVAWANRTSAVMTLGGGRAGVDQALGLIEQNLKADPSSVDDRRLQAALLAVRPNRRQEAIQRLEALGKSHLLGVDERFLLGTLYLADGRQDRYRAEMLTVLASKEKAPRHLAHFIGFLIGVQELDQAATWLAQLKLQDPDALATLELESMALKAAKRDSDLLALLLARARRRPEQIGAVAKLLDRFEFPKQAEDAFRADVARAPKEPELMLALASFLVRHERLAEAMEILGKAWSTCPPDQVAMTAMGVYDFPSASQEQKDRIEAWLVEAAQRRPEAVGLLPRLAAIRLRQSRFDEAESLFRQALASDPDNAQALNDLAWILSQREAGKAQEGLELIERAFEVVGENPALLDTRAVIYLGLGQPDRALRDLSRALILRPSSRSSYLHLARAHLMAHNEAEARKALQQAEDLGLKLETVDPLERDAYQRLRASLTLSRAD